MHCWQEMLVIYQNQMVMDTPTLTTAWFILSVSWPLDPKHGDTSFPILAGAWTQCVHSKHLDLSPDVLCGAHQKVVILNYSVAFFLTAPLLSMASQYTHKTKTLIIWYEQSTAIPVTRSYWVKRLWIRCSSFSSSAQVGWGELLGEFDHLYKPCFSLDGTLSRRRNVFDTS